MKIQHFIIVLVCALIAISQTNAQEIDPNRKRAIDSLALEKVKDLSKYISLIGDKKTPFSEATRVMDSRGAFRS